MSGLLFDLTADHQDTDPLPKLPGPLEEFSSGEVVALGWGQEGLHPARLESWQTGRN